MLRSDHRFFSDPGGSDPDEEDVASLIADIAAVFHWPLGELLALEIDDLIHWHTLAVDRWNQMNKAKDR
ncbi:GpE family phage tail protein [Aurantiacibacter suaedae]|uniref:GpE family phage tail protein n=1 Tax=Aurantiacibacter suaedae TaxID=2545755 RepID=UPI003BADBD7D